MIQSELGREMMKVPHTKVFIKFVIYFMKTLIKNDYFHTLEASSFSRWKRIRIDNLILLDIFGFYWVL